MQKKFGGTMVKRDPNKTARNKRIAEIKIELRKLLPQVLKETGVASEASFNAKIGGKSGEFIDLKNEVIISPEQYAGALARRVGTSSSDDRLSNDV